MEWSRVKPLLAVVCGGVAFYCALQNLGAVAAAAAAAAGILSPFLLGGAIAFVLNVPMRCIERRLFARQRQMDRVRRPLALVLTVAAVSGVLALVSFVVGPGVAGAARSIAERFPDALKRLEEQLRALEAYLPHLQQMLETLEVDDWKDLSERAAALARDWGGGLLSTGGGLIGGVVSGVSNFAIGLIFAFYILLQKERLCRQGRQTLYALLPQAGADRVLEILRLANRTFSHFLSGQCLEACILGSMFVVVMSLLRLPYALLIGVLIAVTALIPIVGAFIGCGVGAALIAVADPWQAVLFVAVFLVLQQVEGNLIYPHVVGSSVGLPSIWVLAAVTLGGKLMGIAGMLLFIPLCSVLYALARDGVRDRLRRRGVPPGKWRDPPPA